MSEVFPGEPASLRYAGTSEKKLTRAGAQERLDDLYAGGHIDLDAWRIRTTILSEPTFRHYEVLI